MKNGRKRLAGFLALLLLMASMPLNSIKARAGDWMESEEWMYILDEVHGIEGEECVELKKYTGEDTDIIIPAEIEGKKVTSINLFSSIGYNVERVTIPHNENAWRKRPVKSMVCGLKDSMVRQEYDKINPLNGLK